jgi:hypothetical protein
VSFAAFLTNALNYDPLVQHRKSLFYVLGNPYVVKRFIVNVYYVVTLDASEVVMRLGIRIETFRFAITLNQSNDSDFIEGLERSVHRIKRDVGKELSYSAEYVARTGMVFRPDQLPVYGGTLRRDPETIGPAFLLEPSNQDGLLFRFHIGIITT